MEEEQMIWKSQSTSMVSATVGRMMNTLLSARPKKLDVAISRLDSVRSTGSSVPLEESLWFLYKFLKDAAEKEENLDHVLVPIIENYLKHKDSMHGIQAMILLNWLFHDELIFQALATNLTTIIYRKEDHFTALGWCTLVRGLVECQNVTNQSSANGIKENYGTLLQILCPCIKRLSFLICNGSILQDGFELPTRLSVAAADCILVLTEALSKVSLPSNMPSIRPKSLNSNTSNQPVTLLPATIGERKPETSCKADTQLLVWNYLDELVILVQRLFVWSRKSRSLHAKGLEQVLKWLQEIKEHYGHFQYEAGSKNFRTGIMLLSSCWKHYGMLLRLEDLKFSQRYKELLEQYLSGIQFYTDGDSDMLSASKDSGSETRMFFLTCLSLLLGRLDTKKLENILSEHGLRISKILISQLHCGDEDVLNTAVSIFRATLFRINCSSSGSFFIDSRQIEAVIASLLSLLNERDGTSRAVVLLTAECCFRSKDSQVLQQVLKHLVSGSAPQRRNAIDVISELINLSSDSEAVLSQDLLKDIANHLLQCLGDEDLEICEQMPRLLGMLDPSLFLSTIVHLVYSSEKRVQSSATNALIAVLKCNNDKVRVLCMVLDSLSTLCESKVSVKEEGLMLEPDRVLRLISKWAKSVGDWNFLVGPLIDKMFAEPSNAIIVKFLSCISEYLVDAVDVVLNRVLLQMRIQNEMNGNFLTNWEGAKGSTVVSTQMQQALFDRLCPLLILRMLPLRVFSDLKSSVIYSQSLEKNAVIYNADVDANDQDCVAGLLLHRALSKFEFEDVRKLAAELCGRIHPQVLFPSICSHLEHAVVSQDILKIKACLFSICTSLVVRGMDSVSHPLLVKIRKILENILLWPSLDGDEVSKAQHGCIDCLALMICTELNPTGSLEDFNFDKMTIVRGNDHVDTETKMSVLDHVIHQLAQDDNVLVSHLRFHHGNSPNDVPVPVPFRLCMANVLISTCQKISDSGKKPFAWKMLPRLIHILEVTRDSVIRAACIQVMFSAVYHLKSAVLPYSSNLLTISLSFLEKGADQERMAAAKLLASLMASEDVVVKSISGGLLGARSLLSSICSEDTSAELQQVCRTLLECVSLR